MEEKTKAISRPRRKQNAILVPALPEEKSTIQKNAAAAGLPVTEYLRRVGMGYPIQARLDAGLIVEMSKVNADLGRLGGLLKLWLTDHKKREGMELDIRRVLRIIESRMDEMKGAVNRLLKL